MKSKTPLKTCNPQKCKTKRRRKARGKNFILDHFSNKGAWFISEASKLRADTVMTDWSGKSGNIGAADNLVKCGNREMEW